MALNQHKLNEEVHTNIFYGICISDGLNPHQVKIFKKVDLSYDKMSHEQEMLVSLVEEAKDLNDKINQVS